MNTARGIVSKQNLAAGVNSEVELQSQPMDLASKNISNSPSVANVSSIQNRLAGETSKPIYLVCFITAIFKFLPYQHFFIHLGKAFKFWPCLLW